MQSCYSSVLLINAYSCDHKFKHNHYGYECYGNFRAFTDFFELFFLQGGLIIQQTSLMTSRKQEFGATIWNSIWCSPIHTGSNVNTPHNKIKCPSCGQIFSQEFYILILNTWLPLWKNWLKISAGSRFINHKCTTCSRCTRKKITPTNSRCWSYVRCALSVWWHRRLAKDRLWGKSSHSSSAEISVYAVSFLMPRIFLSFFLSAKLSFIKHK